MRLGWRGKGKRDGSDDPKRRGSRHADPTEEGEGEEERGRDPRAAEMYEALKEKEPQFLNPPSAFDGTLYELDQLSRSGVLEDPEAAELGKRYQERLNQGEAVLELLNNKVSENYTSFVEGMNKIQAVGQCSELTTQTCDRGKGALRRAKEEMVKSALEVTQTARRKHNLQRLSVYLRELQVLHARHQEVTRLMRAGEHARALLAITRGMQALRADAHPAQYTLRRAPGGSLGMTLKDTRIARVVPGGLADQGGITPGMVIEEIAGRVVTTQKEISQVLQSAGTDIHLKVLVPDLRLAELAAVGEIVDDWEEAKRKCSLQLEQELQELCKYFEPDRITASLHAFSAIGQLQRSADQLRHRWAAAVRKMASDSIRMVVVKRTQSLQMEERLDTLPFRGLVAEVLREDAARAMLFLLGEMAHCLWSYRHMSRWLQQQEIGQTWYKMLVGYQSDFFQLVQHHFNAFLEHISLSRMHLSQVLELYSHLLVFARFAEDFNDGGFSDEFLRDVRGHFLGFLRKSHHVAVVDRLLRALSNEEAWGVMQGGKEDGTLIFGSAEINRKRGALAAKFFSSEQPGENPFREARVHNGFEFLDERGGDRGGGDSPKRQGRSNQASGSPRDGETVVLTPTSVMLRREVRRYADVGALYPNAAADAFELALDLVRLYAYSVCSHFCHTSPQVYYPENDRELSPQVHAALAAMAEAAKRWSSADSVPEGKDQPPFAPPALQPRVLAKLGAGEHSFGLKERLVGAESVLPIVRCLESELPALAEAAANPAFARDAARGVEQLVFLSQYQGKVMAKRLSLLMLPLEGFPKMISEAKWEPKSAETESSVYVGAILREVKAFGEELTRSTAMLPCGGMFSARMWRYIVDHIWNVLVEGYSRVKKCNDNGRSLMTVDLMSLQHALKSASPPGTELPSTEAVEDYIKAFWKIEAGGDDYIDWVRNAHTRYTHKQLTALLGINSGLLERGAKKKERQELTRRVEDELQRLDHRDRQLLDLL
eukprot:Hpha_TRINITY_DN22168_c0_g1::TRINITY_DN22168_c0_g1_i1::g.103650::m.103650